jgi:endogenous inhibitor of DNA gyrase (YacG/DUF329 family)
MPAKPPDDAGAGKASVKRSGKPCPICRKPATEASQPFCSARCREVDLNRWLSNSYALPVRDDDQDAE